VRPGRSYLYAPGHKPERLRTAFDHGADVVVFDLEDGVPPDVKDEARSLIVAALRARPAWVRNNPAGDTSEDTWDGLLAARTELVAACLSAGRHPARRMASTTAATTSTVSGRRLAPRTGSASRANPSSGPDRSPRSRRHSFPLRRRDDESPHARPFDPGRSPAVT
jgi:citrate lyase subunit beta/citryl-CoA lyase